MKSEKFLSSFYTTEQELESAGSKDKRKLNYSEVSKICFDVIIFIIVAIPVLGRYSYVATPAQRGFFCNDDTIVYLFKEDTVSNAMLYGVGYSFPVALIFLNELYEVFKRTRPRWETYENSTKFFMVDLAWNLYTKVGTFLFGAFVNEIVTNVTKLIIGRPRPCFLDVCMPNIDCTTVKPPYMYILNYTCMGNDTAKIKDSRKSFPSGHSTFAFYTMLFLAIYFQYCTTWRGPRLMKPCLQIAFLLIAWCTAMSRIYDNKHHWSDVTIGTIIGCIMAVGTVKFVSDFAPRLNKCEEKTCNHCQESGQATAKETDISLCTVVATDCRAHNE